MLLRSPKKVVQPKSIVEQLVSYCYEEEDSVLEKIQTSNNQMKLLSDEVSIKGKLHTVDRLYVLESKHEEYCKVGWVLVESIGCCMICGTKWKSSCRKNFERFCNETVHCRACGNLVCTAHCGQEYAFIDGLSEYGEQQVCLQCSWGQEIVDINPNWKETHSPLMSSVSLFSQPQSLVPESATKPSKLSSIFEQAAPEVSDITVDKINFPSPSVPDHSEVSTKKTDPSSHLISTGSLSQDLLHAPSSIHQLSAPPKHYGSLLLQQFQYDNITKQSVKSWQQMYFFLRNGYLSIYSQPLFAQELISEEEINYILEHENRPSLFTGYYNRSSSADNPNRLSLITSLGSGNSDETRDSINLVNTRASLRASISGPGIQPQDIQLIIEDSAPFLCAYICLAGYRNILNYSSIENKVSHYAKLASTSSNLQEADKSAKSRWEDKLTHILLEFDEFNEQAKCLVSWSDPPLSFQRL
jgi:hypothetical protein